MLQKRHVILNIKKLIFLKAQKKSRPKELEEDW